MNLLNLASENPIVVTPDFDSPHNSVWTIAVDIGGNISVLSVPNIHPSYFENGESAESIGLPSDCDLPAGMYSITCSFTEHTNIEGGQVDEYEFNILKSKPLISRGILELISETQEKDEIIARLNSIIEFKEGM